MWEVYYGMYIVTCKKQQEKQKEEYNKEQQQLLKEGKIKNITPFKHYKVSIF